MPDLTSESFAPHMGTEFFVDDPARGRRVALRLSEVTGLGLQPEAPRAVPFTLTFHGPAQPLLEQRIYRLEHRVLGPLDIFLVPVGTDGDEGLCYEAVFN
jgi:hypothetical protein